ncbi:hypothetical protein E2C01_082210 [Portunus trituberculatus]|uniref:Ionotropic glutamate receptor C-terminal domain-containing protein n=1 Tax=Portunus trituberculatus TaxID=210409 RepID=A0A5B7IYH1_PORTR|nr:hypothetical protein [Portunus trituberculatus]
MTTWLRDNPRDGQTSLVDEALRTLLGQNLSVGCRRMGSRAKLVLGAWLIFALVIGSAYRGNLTAFLTIPKYPPRPETLPQLVEVVDRCVCKVRIQKKLCSLTTTILSRPER